MRLSSISIKRFRGIREGQIDDLVDVNLLIGRNNCGKSTVAEAITRLGWYGYDRVGVVGGNQIRKWFEYRNESEEFPDVIWFANDTSKQIEIVGEFSFHNASSYKHGIRFLKPPKASGELDTGPFHDVNPIDIDQSQKFGNSILVFRPRDGSKKSVEGSLWAELYKHRKDKNLKLSLNEIFGLDVEQLQIINDVITLGYEDYALPIDSLGDGARTALRCLMVLASREETMFIVEEPECHQHPGSLVKFARAMCKQAKQQGVQLLLTTHSVECIRAFLEGSEAAGSQCAVHHLKLDDGKLESRKLDSDTTEGLLESGLDIRSLDLYV